MEQRVLITIVLCVGILVGWMYLFPPPEQQQSRGGAKARASKPAATTTPRVPEPAEPAAPGSARTPGDRGPEKVAAYENPGLYRIEISSWGGRIKSFQLLGKQFKDRGEQPGWRDLLARLTGSGAEVEPEGGSKPLDIVGELGEADWPLGLQIQGAGVALTGGEEYELVESMDGSMTFRWRDPEGRLQVDKVFTFHKGIYPIDLEVRVTNLGPKPFDESLLLDTAGMQDPDKASGGMFSGIPDVTTALCRVQGELVSKPVRDLEPEWESHFGAVDWAGAANRYFLRSIVPVEVPKEHTLGCLFRGQGDLLEVAVTEGAGSLAPGETRVHKYALYFGPKDFYLLKKIGYHLNEAIDFGWLAIICEPMLWAMRLFYRWTGNWGVAIIFLTIMVKLLLLYPTTKSMVSMNENQKKMARLKPELDKIKQQYAHDPQKLNEETMALYKRHGVGVEAMLGGCLPMLLQMPIYFALYRTIYSSVELYQANFALYITDLSAPDPYFVTPVLLGVLMYLQQKMTPASVDNAQAKMMQWMMPILFTAIMLFLPSGLVLYILANSTLTIIQQMVIRRRQASMAGARA